MREDALCFDLSAQTFEAEEAEKFAIRVLSTEITLGLCEETLAHVLVRTLCHTFWESTPPRTAVFDRCSLDMSEKAYNRVGEETSKVITSEPPMPKSSVVELEKTLVRGKKRKKGNVQVSAMNGHDPVSNAIAEENAQEATHHHADRNGGFHVGDRAPMNPSNPQPSNKQALYISATKRPDAYRPGMSDRSTNGPGPSNHSNLQMQAKALFNARRTLPIWSHKEEIRQGLRDKDIVLLIGETGSGKSTQVPQFLINEEWCKPQRIKLADGGKSTKTATVGGCIAITQPRRVAAISLARRVAEEMGTPLGSLSPASKVGYSVRFDNSISRSTRIKFLTEGMLLQELLRDPWLRQYSAVIVDEVHERGVNVDLVMGFLRNMVSDRKEGRGGVPMKVVVMSATADMQGIAEFFEDGYRSQPMVGKNNATSTDDESEWSGISSSDEERQGPVVNGKDRLHNKMEHPNHPAKKGAATQPSTDTVVHGGSVGFQRNSNVPVEQMSSCLATCYIEGRQHEVKILYSSEPAQDFVDAALRTTFQIHYQEPMPGDILVFLTGQEAVESLEKLVKEYALGMGPELPKLLVLPLFAALPQAAQQRVFQPAPPKTRKVILATNIAETSVTVSGVRFVVDCGKAKTKQFRTRLGLDSLLVKPISKSAAIQRKGRAGREAPGKCYRLYTEQDYLKLQESNTPEILRCDLSQSILTMKARGVHNIVAFPFLDRPPREALEKALMQLYQLKALNESGEISAIGLQIAKLPLSASLGRVLIAAAEPDMDCLVDVIDIISCLSVENIFLNLTSEEKKEEAEMARRELYRREGDHLTLLATVQAYASEKADRKAWAERYFVSHRAMQAVMVRVLACVVEMQLNGYRMSANSFELKVTIWGCCCQLRNRHLMA